MIVTAPAHAGAGIGSMPGKQEKVCPVPDQFAFANDRWLKAQTGYYEDVVAEAAALWESLSQNHPFVDGNKRTAFAVTFTFLAINDYSITADEDALLKFLIPLYERSAVDFEKLERWLRVNTTTG